MPRKALIIASCFAIMSLAFTIWILRKVDNPKKSENMELIVEGMTCDACARSLEHTLQKVPGIRAVKASFAERKVMILYDISLIDERNIKDEIAKAGYRVVENYVEKMNVNAFAEQTGFFSVPLACPAVPGIGCGPRAKPILEQLARHPAVADVRINRTGTILAIRWSDQSSPEQRSDAIAQVQNISLIPLDKEDSEKLQKNFSPADWYGTAEVHHLTDEEGEVLASRFVDKLVKRRVLPQEHVLNFKKEVVRLFTRCLKGSLEMGQAEKELISLGRRYLDSTGVKVFQEEINALKCK
ncbi:cation transporter [Rhodocaloribacter litoris]|uniref:heavy-metal-associated domain-containing protein n=1 Tax=Rhodocaloribacter litoris TaxID=2558931 RepID=UPI001E429ACC|nr:heavy-metal-associated domain-containing protein [Rhodocaloribacter litoris]QXD13692.1 cation transporter [Rhodocaloribacter litoris]